MERNYKVGKMTLGFKEQDGATYFFVDDGNTTLTDGPLAEGQIWGIVRQLYDASRDFSLQNVANEINRTNK